MTEASPPHHVNNSLSSPTLSLIICTRNRAESLESCLEELPTDDVSAVEGEVVLVDNGSEDCTPTLMERFKAEAHCPVTVVTEPNPGLSRARNAGLRHAEGNTIVFTDDDCYLGEGYLQIACKVFEDAPFSYCGGRILLHDPTDASYGVQTKEEFEIIPPYSFIPAGKLQGANLVVHRRVFEEIGAFDTDLGAGAPFRCEDLDFVARASHAGFAGAHVPELVVHHHHGRKPGEDIRKLKAANANARGAYYAKFLLRGHYSYAWGWLKEGLLSRKDVRITIPRFVREVKGAVGYFLSTRKE